MLPDCVTPCGAVANTQQVETSLQENVAPRQSFVDLDRWMERYQRADPEAPTALVVALSPPLLRFFRSQVASREHADDLLQETWLRIHRVRHTYRPGEPVLPWVYAIARRVRVDGYRRTRRIMMHETAMEVLPERPAQVESGNSLSAFDTLVATLPEGQREVVTMLKMGGLSLDEVARATSSTVGAVKQKAHELTKSFANCSKSALKAGCGRKSMNCRDVDRVLIESEKSVTASLPAQAQGHLMSCERCRQLVRALEASDGAEAPSPALLLQLERSLAEDLQPVRPLAPQRYFLAAFAAIYVLIVAFGVYRMGAFAFSVMSPLQAIVTLGALAASAGVLTYSLV
jgi:RNA polymerase sigma-70 factor (ECF subfamily)